MRPKASGSPEQDADHELPQQEVEGEAGEAGEQQQRVAADEAALDDADDAAGAADRLPVPLTTPSTTKRSKVSLAKRPIASAGRTTRKSIASSKYHLLRQSW